MSFAQPEFTITEAPAYTFTCSGCGERYIGGPRETDSGTQAWIAQHSSSFRHYQWEEGEIKRRCTHNERTDIVPVAEGYMRRCNVCWRYLFRTDVFGNPLAEC